MSVRREVLVFVFLGLCAWLIGLRLGGAMSGFEQDVDRGKIEKVIERDPPAAFDIRRAA
jgi:hypothetical protein